jgi:hypothetical protein
MHCKALCCQGHTLGTIWGRPGLPAPLQPRDKQQIEDQHRLALVLGPYRQDLLGLRDHGEAIARKLVNTMRREPAASTLLTGQERTIPNFSLVPAHSTLEPT